MDINTSFRFPVDKHVVVKVDEQYPSNANDTKTVGEEISMIYTVTSEGLVWVWAWPWAWPWPSLLTHGSVPLRWR